MNTETDSATYLYRKEFQYWYKLSYVVLVIMYCLYSTTTISENIAFYINFEMILMIFSQVIFCFLFPGFEISHNVTFNTFDLSINILRSVLTWIFFILIYKTESLSFMQSIAFICLIWGEYILIKPHESIWDL